LIRIVFIQKGYGNTHHAVIVLRYFRNFAYFYGIVVVIFREFFWAVILVKKYLPVAFFDVKVGKPDNLRPAFYNAVRYSVGTALFLADYYSAVAEDGFPFKKRSVM
jgi:hypothetical protein